jgi:hypothetical protein
MPEPQHPVTDEFHENSNPKNPTELGRCIVAVHGIGRSDGKNAFLAAGGEL